jgi:hypothetical protein
MVLDRLKYWSVKNRNLLGVSLLALAVRLYWNLKVHPPLDYISSDMAGYLERANLLLESGPWKPYEFMTFFPYGTHFFIFLIKWFFGGNSREAIAIAFALLGALSVAYTYATAERISASKWVRRGVGLILISYYPWVSLGGYMLSETPFALGVSATAFYGLRLADEGRPRDAWLLGLALGLGATVRPQILISAAFFFLCFLLRRRVFHGFTPGLFARVAIPLALILAFSSARLYWHTGAARQGGQLGLVSTNGPLNFAFGRCHSGGIESVSPEGRSFFAPPSLGALRAYGAKHPSSPIQLDPAMGERLTVQGRMWDAKPLYDLSRACIEKTGYLRQVKYAVTHVILLWGYNIIWPDQTQKSRFRTPMMIWCNAHSIFLMPPAAAAMLLAFRRRRARSMLLALHVWGLVVMAMVYFGDTRYRAPYDGLIIILALQSYASAFRWLAARFQSWRERSRSEKTPSPPSLGSLAHPLTAGVIR